MQKWEYLFALFDRDDWLEAVNGKRQNIRLERLQYFKQVGEEGWELVHYQFEEHLSEAIFKRPKS